MGRIAVTGTHSVGKTTICIQILSILNSQEEFVKTAITGAHGTGKTTLAKLIAGRGSYKYLPEAPFQAFQAGFLMNEASIEAELWIFAKQLEMEHGDDWVADKCFIDLLAYARYFLGDVPEWLETVALKAIKQYDLIFYLPIEFGIEDDGYRSLDPSFQRSIDNLIMKILQDYEIRYVALAGSPEQRYKVAKTLLGYYQRGG